MITWSVKNLVSIVSGFENGHFFDSRTKVFVWDVEGVIVLKNGHKGHAYDGWKVNPEAEEVLSLATRADSGHRNAYWCSKDAFGVGDFFPSDAHRSLVEHEPFNRVNLYVIGLNLRTDGEAEKNLPLLHPNLSNVAAAEDDNYFKPANRVIRYNQDRPLRLVYQTMREIAGI